MTDRSVSGASARQQGTETMSVKRSTRWVCVCACSTALVALAAQPAKAQQPGSDATDRALIQQLQKRVDELEEQVKKLQAQSAAAEDKRTAEPPAESAGQPEEGMRDMLAPLGLGGLQIRGFNDVSFHAFRDGGSVNTFTLGQLDLFLSSRLVSDFNTVGEVVFEAGDSNGFGVDVERLLLQYSPSDRFSVGAGRFHTAIGFYNTAYHHGNWFQTATGRPFIFRFEDDGGILPVHGVGVTAQGQIPSGGVGLKWVAEISNGRHSRSPDEEPVQNVEDENAHKAVNVALLARPTRFPGLQAGLSVYRDRLEPAAQPMIDETIIAAHLVYQSPLFEQLNEAIFIRHAPVDAEPAMTTSSFYSQISRQFGRYRPYLRYEYLDVPANDVVFRNDMGRSYGPTVGLRFDAAAPVAIKLEYVRLTGGIQTQTNGLTVQLGFAF
jgi:hypothetical protein